jgi:sulfate adenylyltransferase
MHAVHYEMTMRASKQANAHILIHPVVGMSKPGDLHYYSRVHCYEAILKQYPKSLVSLALIPMAMRMAGPREALMNAIIRQNYGCTHYILGTEHAGPPNVRDSGKRFYPTGASQKYVEQYKDDIDIEIINIEELCYDEDKERFIPRTANIQALCSSESFSNARVLSSLLKQEEIPDWVTYPEVLTALQQSYPPRSQQGLTLFFTGIYSSKDYICKIY